VTRNPVAAILVAGLGSFGAEARADEPSSENVPSWDVELGYTSDFWRSVTGGLDSGKRFIGHAELVVDWVGDGALRGRVHLIDNNGRSFSEIVGDTHVVSNIEADRASRVLEAWLEYAPDIEDRSLKIGLYDLNSEFDVSEVGGALINSTFGIGVDVAQSGLAGPSIFPYTGLAIRGRWRLDDRWLMQGVVIDGVPIDEQAPRRFASLKLDSDEGALWVAELEHQAERWRAVIGHWRYTSSFEELESLGSGQSRSSGGNSGTYGFVEGPVWQAGDRRLLAMLRLGVAEPRFNVIGSTLQAGLVLERAWLGLEGEHVAIGVAHARNGGPARRGAMASGTERTQSETVVELTWRVPVQDRLVLQPDIQYILNPGSVPGVSSALAIGLRVEFDLSPN
jgi:porin